MATVIPDGPESCNVSYRVIVPPENFEAMQPHWEKNNQLMLLVINEDIATGEQIQKGFSTGANETVLFGRFEHAIRMFHDRLTSTLSQD